MLPDFNEFDLPQIAASPLVRLLHFLESMESTQTAAAQLAADPSLVSKTLVLTARQTAGRGRGGNAWWSAAGGLTFSWVLDPDAYALTAADSPRVSLAVALAVCNTVEMLGPPQPVGIKWPNDVYLGGRKAAGVLVERIERRRGGPRLIVGVGLNVNNPLEGEAPADVRAAGISLLEATQRPHDLTEVLLALLLEIETQLLAAGRDDAQQPLLWQARSLLDGRRVTVVHGGREVTGHCEGIADDGTLRVRTASCCERLGGGAVTRIEPPLVGDGNSSARGA